jgi:hypothetical protein
MAFTTPATAVAGNILTASWLNTYVRDNVAWSATDSPACRAYNNATISHSSTGNWQAVTLNSERFDNAAMHSTSSNTERITVPSGGAGKYLVAGNLAWLQNATGQRQLGIGVNGVATFAAVQGGPIVSGTVNTNLAVMAVYSMAVADYFAMGGFQDSGGALDMTSQANYSPEFYAFWFRT